MYGRLLSVTPTCKMFAMFGWPESASHRVTLTQKAFPVVFVEIRRKHLDGDASPERLLVAAIDNARAAPADLDGVREPGGRQLGSYPAPSWGRSVVGLALSDHKGDRPLSEVDDLRS